MTILVDDCCNDYLFQAADEVRSQYVGEGVQFELYGSGYLMFVAKTVIIVGWCSNKQS